MCVCVGCGERGWWGGGGPASCRAALGLQAVQEKHYRYIHCTCTLQYVYTRVWVHCKMVNPASLPVSLQSFLVR